MTVEIPPSLNFGYAACRIIHTIADRVTDPNRDPDAIAGQCAITFKPLVRDRVVDGDTIVLHETLSFRLNGAGVLVDANDLPGVGLITGIYDVSFELTQGKGAKIPDRRIEITTAHTVSNPLQLASAGPPAIPPGSTVQTILLPGTVVEGGFLQMVGGAARWTVVGPGGGGGTPAPDATTTIKGLVRLAGDLSGTSTLPTVPGLTNKSDTDHVHTPNKVGLGNVNNTSDATKPVSGPQQAALDSKVTEVRYNIATGWPSRPAGAPWGVLWNSANSSTAPDPPTGQLQMGDARRKLVLP